MVRIGVPQGSILGPLLFILYVNDICDVVGRENALLICYADDTNAINSMRDLDPLIEAGGEVLRHLTDYFGQNKLLVNVTITKCA